MNGDTAVVENFKDLLWNELHYQAVEKLVKINSKDTLFSNGKTKIVSKNGKMWIYWGTYKRKLKDYSQKKEEIAYIRKNYALRLYKNSAVVKLNQTLGARNYYMGNLDAIELTYAIETPKDSVIRAFQIVADSIIAREKTKVDFFKSFLNKENLDESEIISFLNTATFTKQIEKEVLMKIIIHNIEKLS